jgi:hypothetical protein
VLDHRGHCSHDGYEGLNRTIPANGWASLQIFRGGQGVPLAVP